MGQLAQVTPAYVGVRVRMSAEYTVKTQCSQLEGTPPSEGLRRT